jgi:ferredoxin
MSPTATMPRIYLESCDQSFECAATQNVLRGMECLGRKGIPIGCRGGGCGVCKVRVLRGRYHTEKMSRVCVSAEQQQQGYALACRLYADEGDLYLQVVGPMRRALQLGDVARARRRPLEN